MQRQLLLFIFVLNYSSIRSLKFPILYSKVNIVFYYISPTTPQPVEMRIATHEVPKASICNAYFLSGKRLNDSGLIIKTINYTLISCSPFLHGGSDRNRIHISIPDPLDLNDFYILRIETGMYNYTDFIQLLSNLSRSISNKNNFNLTCFFLNPYQHYPNKPKDPYTSPLSTTSLFGIIFLSACIAIVFGLCIGWFAIIYYRQFTQYRMKKKLRAALAKTTQQILDKSPIIIFEPNDKDNENIDEDPTCAICLESFTPKEKLRKLICSHCFHITCIDPWLLSHQSCPLCNRNILRDSIPSISSSIMAIINEQHNDETTSVINNDSTQTGQAQQ